MCAVDVKGIEITPKNLIISESANLILPFHKELDEIREDFAGKAKIGTTRRGIGPAYEDKVGRRSIRVMDLFSEKDLDNRLEEALKHHNAIRRGLKKEKSSCQKENNNNEEKDLNQENSDEKINSLRKIWYGT